MPMMKRDYEIVMNCLGDCITEANKEWPPRVGSVAEGIARELASVFKSENSRFDEGRFLRGCGIRGDRKVPALDQSNEDGLEYQRLNAPQSNN